MIYVKEDNKIKKYDVEVNKEELELAKLQIILGSSYLTHVDKEVLEQDLPNEYDFKRNRNFTKQKVGTVETKGFFSYGWENVYKVVYDKAEFPEVISLIDEVLDGKYDNVIKLLNYKEPKEKVESDKLDISISTIEDAKKAKKQADEIIKKLYNQKLNEKRIPVDEFMSKVRGTIKLILIDEVDLDDFNKIYNFVDDSIKEKIDNKLCMKI